MQSEHNLIGNFSNDLSGIVSKLFGNNVLSMKISDASKSNLSFSGISGYVASIILSLQTSSYPPETTVGQVLCPTFAYYIVVIISVAVLFIIFKIIFAVICAIIKDAYKNKKIEKYDKTLGFFLGLVNGIINLELVIMIISIIPLGFFQNIYLNIQLSIITKFIEDINLFELIITSISRGNVVEVIKAII